MNKIILMLIILFIFNLVLAVVALIDKSEYLIVNIFCTLVSLFWVVASIRLNDGIK